MESKLGMAGTAGAPAWFLAGCCAREGGDRIGSADRPIEVSPRTVALAGRVVPCEGVRAAAAAASASFCFLRNSENRTLAPGIGTSDCFAYVVYRPSEQPYPTANNPLGISNSRVL